VTVSDGEQSARFVVFSDFEGAHIPVRSSTGPPHTTHNRDKKDRGVSLGDESVDFEDPLAGVGRIASEYGRVVAGPDDQRRSTASRSRTRAPGSSSLASSHWPAWPRRRSSLLDSTRPARYLLSADSAGVKPTADCSVRRSAIGHLLDAEFIAVRVVHDNEIAIITLHDGTERE